MPVSPFSSSSVRARRLLIGFGIIFALWLLLVGTFNSQEVVAGGVVALVVALISLPRLTLLDGIRLTPALPLHLGRYLLVFMRALVEANFDMARRVLSPSLPIRPVMVEVETRLSSALGRLLLANSITLTPGTLAVDVVGDHIRVHWIDHAAGTDLEHATRAIAENFERHLKGFVN